MDAEDALRKLMEGNVRFVKGEMKRRDFAARRKELLGGQHPFATVLTCSDSRVVPEFIFDAGLGEIFKVETAGNVVDAVALGSLEYGVEHLRTPILVVLGHTLCGAVTACCKEKGEPHGNLGEIMKRIKPAVEKRRGEVEPSIEENIICVKNCILSGSPAIKKAVGEGKLRIVLAKYILESGEVRILG